MSDLEKRIANIEERNKKVENDKAWEVSKTRITIIVIMTYIFASLYIYLADTTNPFLGAIIPSFGFLLSTQSLIIIKKLWLKSKIENEK